jgi:hypothetical protein
MTSWPGCDALLLTSAARNFSCRAVLHHALLALASWFQARSANAHVDTTDDFYDSVNACCALAHDVLYAYDDDVEMISAAVTVLSMFSRDKRTLQCVVGRRETLRLIVSRLQERCSDVSCSSILMSVLRDCSAFASGANDKNVVLRDIIVSPCISVMISCVAQFNQVAVDSRSGSQDLRDKANLLLNATSGLVLNLSTRASTLGVNDSLLTSGLIKALVESAAFVTSSLSTSCNVVSIIGRLLHSQSLRDELCFDVQHATKLIKWCLAIFHEHIVPSPRAMILAAICALLESSACRSMLFKAGGASIVFDAVKSLAVIHKNTRGLSDVSSAKAVFVFSTAAAISSFIYNPAPWLADLHSSGHLRLQALLTQTLGVESNDLAFAAATAALMLLVIPHPSPSFVRPPSCSYIFGNGPVVSSDNPCWIAPVSGVHLRSMTDQADADRIMQAMRGVLAYCDTDDLTSESSKINVHKLFAMIRGSVSRISAGGGGSVADPNNLLHLSNIFAAAAGLIGHVAYKLAFLSGRLYRENQRNFKQAPEFNGVEDDYALLQKRPDIIEEAISERVHKLRLQVKQSDYPAHKAMLVISNEESTGVNPDEVLRQYGTGGSVALVHSGKAGGHDVKSVFLGFSDTATTPIPFLQPPPHFGQVPSIVAVEGAAGFYKRHKVLSTGSSEKRGGNGIDTLLESSSSSFDVDVVASSEIDVIGKIAMDMIKGMELHALDAAIIFTLKHAAGLGALTIRPVLNAAQARLQLESEWDHESFASATNSLRGNVQMKSVLVNILQRHTEDLSIMRPCLAVLCLSMQSSQSDIGDAHRV